MKMIPGHLYLISIKRHTGLCEVECIKVSPKGNLQLKALVCEDHLFCCGLVCWFAPGDVKVIEAL